MTWHVLLVVVQSILRFTGRVIPAGCGHNHDQNGHDHKESDVQAVNRELVNSGTIAVLDLGVRFQAVPLRQILVNDCSHQLGVVPLVWFHVAERVVAENVLEEIKVNTMLMDINC